MAPQRGFGSPGIVTRRTTVVTISATTGVTDAGSAMATPAPTSRRDRLKQSFVS
jgi:hypothetical protein